jgi:hypothetical protein
LASCHINWRNLYELNHKPVPELTRSMLHDLKTIEKVFIEKNNKKAKANVAKAGTAPQKELSVPRKKGKGGGSRGPAPKKARTANYCKWCKEVNGPYQTHNTSYIRLTTPAIVVGLTRTAKRQTSLISPSIPQRSPGKKAVVTRDRWLI